MSRSTVPAAPLLRAAAISCAAALTLTGALALGLPASAGSEVLVPAVSPAAEGQVDPAEATGAESLVVTTLADSGPGSLRAALERAATTPEPDTITVAPSVSGDLVLESPLRLDSSVEVVGPGRELLRLVPAEDLVASGASFIEVGATDPASAPEVSLSGLSLSGTDERAVMGNTDMLGEPLFAGSVVIEQSDLSMVSMQWGTGMGDVSLATSSLARTGLSTSDLAGGLTVTDSTVVGDSILELAEVAGDVVLSGVHVSADDSFFANLTLSRVGGSVTIVDSTFAGQVNGISITEVGGSVVIERTEMTSPDSGVFYGFSVSDVQGSVAVSDTVVTGRYYAFGVTAHGMPRGTTPVSFERVTLVGGADNWSLGLGIIGDGIGEVELSEVAVRDFGGAVNVVGSDGGVRVVDSELHAGLGMEPGMGLAVDWTTSGAVVVERTTVDGFGIGLHSYSAVELEPIVVRDSVFTNHALGAIDVQGEVDVVVEGTYLARAARGIFYDARMGNALTIRSSTFEDLAGAEWDEVPVTVVEGRIDIDSSTFSQPGLTAGSQVTHFVVVEQRTSNPHTEAVSITRSTFSGLGVLKSYALHASDEVVLSHVISDSVDAPGQIRDGYADIDLQGGGRLLVDHSIFSAEQDGLVGAASEVVWGEGVLTGIGAEGKKLGPLADHGGQTPTYVLLEGSAALDAGDMSSAHAAGTDQRGLPRGYKGLDIGAVEMNLGSLAVGAGVTVEAGRLAEVEVTRVDAHDGAWGAVSADMLLLPGTARHGVDYTGSEDLAVTLPAGVDSVLVDVPTVAVLDRGERTLTGQLVVDSSLTPVAGEGTVDVLVLHPRSSADPTEPTDPAGPTDPDQQAEPPVTTGPDEQGRNESAPVVPGQGSPADADSGVGSEGGTVSALARTGAVVGTVLVVAGMLVMAGLALAAARRRLG